MAAKPLWRRRIASLQPVENRIPFIAG